MNNSTIFDKGFASAYISEHKEMIEHWKHTSDPLKRGFAMVLTEAANGGGAHDC